MSLFLNWTVFGLIISHWEAISAFFKGLWDGIVGFFKGAFDNIVKAVNVVKTAFSNVFGAIKGIITNAFRGIVGIVKAPINGIISLINRAIGALNGISVRIPDWVPGLGGQTFGVHLPKIPQLAEGGIIRASAGGTLAQVGEGRYDEAVVPLSPQVLAQLGGGMPRELVVVDADGALIGRMRVEAQGQVATAFKDSSGVAVRSEFGH